MPVASVEKQIVGRVENGAREKKGERLDRELEMLDDDHAGGERRVEQRGQRGERPDEAYPPAAFLQKIVPARVDERRAQHQGDGESAHAAILFRGSPLAIRHQKKTRAIARVFRP